MICFWYLIMWACSALSRMTAQQFYDSSLCFNNASYPGSRYACASSSAAPSTCRAFVAYRANRYYQTAAVISELFRADLATVLDLNNMSLSTESLTPGREVIVPIDCSCSGGYFSGNVTYAVQEHANFSEIACDVFEGLVKSVTLREENPMVGALNLSVPIKCACPGNSSGGAGAARYFLTYAFKEGDYTKTVAQEFSVPVTDIWAANHLDYRSTVYPSTTILIPLTRMPRIRLISPTSPPPPPPPVFLPTEKSSEDAKLRNLYIMASVIGSVLVVVAFVACGLYLRALSRWRSSQRKTKNKTESFNMRSSVVSCLSTRSTPRSGQTRLSSRNSCLSPDLLVGIKYSLNKYMVKELWKATRGFNDDSKIDSEVYKGSLNNTEVIIKGCRSEEAQRVIDLHSNINHVNILSLIGVCYGEGEDAAAAPSYLVYDYPINGCLRDKLSDPENTIRWTRRTQIAFDIATGLHYLHHCIFPSHVHANVSTRNIFVTNNWRAKLADVAAMYGEGDSSHSSKQWFAPEYAMYGTISEKVDIFAFGGVLLELISARGDMDRERLKDSIEFLAGGGNEGRCFEKLRGFVDPSLKDDYPLAEALCLAVLAKACVEDDPQHRPSMDDVIKVLARMV